ncbi:MULTISPECIES: DUF805 domain-containing protein [unclassified Streptomyces]|uniref:DUF805 domain-containing protein n=1 Tax=unclassified Streptomyces TaxID=2593676 RepID=UPI002E2A49DC|nr:DUF805 domain-containing protein [Streptomyces sp. NBC_01429]
MNWYVDVLKQYAVFSGRARRKEYWMFFLFNFVISIAVGVIGGVIGAENLLNALYGLAILIPSLAVAVRRLHDTGRSGWWLLIALVPLVGFIILIVFLALEGEQGPNAHGANPKHAQTYP